MRIQPSLTHHQVGKPSNKADATFHCRSIANLKTNAVANKVKFFESQISQNYKANLTCQIIEKGLEKDLANASNPLTNEIVYYTRPQPLVKRSIQLLQSTLGSMFNRAELETNLSRPTLTYGNLASDLTSMLDLRGVDDIYIDEGEKSFASGEKCIDITLPNDSMLEMTMDHAKKEVTISQAGYFHNDDKVSLQVVKQLIQELLNDYKLKLE
ncbi:hypothetical protein GTG28_05880 [Vibrio sp. OCN044]|uniref:Uncharacterized protein n=1 Tax=Vibrio tetraodonis subsp. pristinus TaxID=2695891 RepID=A0A6L8LSL7_9VIBR|nr:hypothetical protein [Vibrio tetraodonis]MYM58745.1 hypothetical protein [Vibrio tetraodonis subsp. pristinus]